MIEPVVVGLLGITHPHASARVRALREIEGVQVISAADDDPRLEYFTDKYGLDPVAVDALLADQRITAVLVHSKSVDMVPLALRALEAGKSVLVEKPGGGALADLTRLAAAARAPGAIVQVGYNVRFAESVTRARLLLDRGLIGDVVSVSARGAPLVGEHLTQHLNQPADMGGALWIIGCHMLDVLLSFFGPPTSVNARVRKYERLSGTGSREDAAAVILTYPERQVVFDFDVYDRLEWFEGSRITFHGTGGLMEIGILPMSLRVYLPEARNEWSQGWTQWMSSQFTTPFARTEDNRFSELPELANIDFFRSEMTKFVDSIRSGADVAVPASAALDVALVVDACYRSEQSQGANTALAVPGVASPQADRGVVELETTHILGHERNPLTIGLAASGSHTNPMRTSTGSSSNGRYITPVRCKRRTDAGRRAHRLHLRPDRRSSGSERLLGRHRARHRLVGTVPAPRHANRTRDVRRPSQTAHNSARPPTADAARRADGPTGERRREAPARSPPS